MSVSRYIRTVRHLRPIQIYGRVWFRLYRPRADLRPAPRQRAIGGSWHPWAWRTPVMLSPNTFRFLNIEGAVVAPADWHDPNRQRLWLYNLHYFDDLTALDASSRAEWHRELIARWMRDNPPAAGTGWEPYPTSLRIVNWLKWPLSSGQSLSAQLADSVAVQTRWLWKKREIHLMANHLWANAKALVFAGAFFEGSEPDLWLHEGFEILERELDEQILPDGGHFERSPMYHAIVLEDVLDLMNLARTFPDRMPRRLVDRLGKAAFSMLRWLRIMSHPDGGISFFNDAAFGIAAGYAHLSDYAKGLGITRDERPLAAVEALPDSGYVRLENDWATVICDVAPVGPDYVPAHAHADTLSFELSVGHRRVVVNGGTSTYEPDKRRELERGTGSHNTVVVDNENSSEVWGSFRVARRARTFDVKWGREGEKLWLSGSHDGYRRLRGRVTHSRRWSLEPSELCITDRLDGQARTAIAVFGLHPDVRVDTTAKHVSLSFRSDSGISRIEIRCEPDMKIVPGKGEWRPEFGLRRSRQVICVPFAGPSLVTRFTR